MEYISISKITTLVARKSSPLISEEGEQNQDGDDDWYFLLSRDPFQTLSYLNRSVILKNRYSK